MKREHLLRERAITDTINRRNLVLATIAVLFAVVWIGGLRGVVGVIDGYALRPGAVALVVVVMGVYQGFSNLALWLLRGLQRHDIMTIARGMTLAELSLLIDRLTAIRDALREEDTPVAVRRVEKAT